ncbi:MAG: hypothetical protein AB9819_07430 [Methanomassiliicoccales archaeon]
MGLFDKNSIKTPLRGDDLILCLLYADGAHPIKGKLLLMKEAFLASKEIITDRIQIYSFRPYKYGPYSDGLACAINELIQSGLILHKSVKINDSGIRYDYSLSENGITKGKKAFDSLSDDQKRAIIELKRTGERIGYWGMINRVYYKYPQYAINSAIKEDADG